MKFIRPELKSYLVLFMLISSFLIQIHTETTLIRSLNRKFNTEIERKNSSKRSAKPTKKEGEDDPLAIKVFDFTLGLLSCIPVIDEYVEKVKEALDNSDKCSKDELIQAYRDGVAARQEATLQAALNTENKVATIKNALVWKPPQEYDLNISSLEANNPRKACKTIVKELNRQMTTNIEFRDKYKRAYAAAIEVDREGIGYDDFVKSLPKTNMSVFHNEKEKNLNDLKRFLKYFILETYKIKKIKQLKPKIDSGEVNWREIISTTVSLLTTNTLQAELNIKHLNQADVKGLNCGDLPVDNQYENAKPTFMDKLAGGWNAIKYSGKCLLESLPNHGIEHAKGYITEFLTEIGTGFLKNLLATFASSVVNLLAFFAAKAIKLLWWVCKIIYFVYKAIKGEEGEGSIWTWWGKAVGGAIRLIYIAFMPTERRRFKKLKKI